VLLDKRDSFQPVFPLAYDVYFGETFQEVDEFVARGALVVYDNSIDGHGSLRQYMQPEQARQQNATSRDEETVSL
jgi:hypothetical protein